MSKKKAVKKDELIEVIANENYVGYQPKDCERPSMDIRICGFDETGTPSISIDDGIGSTLYIGPTQARELAKILPAWADELDRYLKSQP